MSNFLKIFFEILSLLLFCLEFIESQAKIANVYVRALGKGGKIEIIETNNVANETFDDVVNLRLNAVTERDSNGTAVGTTGPIIHSFNNFAVTEFNLSQVYTGFYKENITNPVYFIDLNATNIIVPADAIRLQVIVFNYTGYINMGGNVTERVAHGFVKFSVIIENWPFCKNMIPCFGPNCCVKGNTTEIGEYLDLDIEITGNITATIIADRTYNLGNSRLVVSNYVTVDNKEIMMPIGFPKLNPRNNCSNIDVFTIRIPRFENKAIYDPIIEMEIPSYSPRIIGLIIVLILVITVLGSALGYCICGIKRRVNNKLIETKA